MAYILGGYFWNLSPFHYDGGIFDGIYLFIYLFVAIEKKVFVTIYRNKRESA